VWRKLTVRFGLLYVFLAIANLVIWRTQSEATWVLFKTFGLEVMTVLFAMTQVPLLMKYMEASDLPPPPPPTD
jgi:intracellular septation protein